jgi:hypothetical protein
MLIYHSSLIYKIASTKMHIVASSASKIQDFTLNRHYGDHWLSKLVFRAYTNLPSAGGRGKLSVVV